MATQTIVTLSLPQVIDLALNSPEIGAVNFNLLHNVLHIMVQQLQIDSTAVEFRGKDGDKIQMLLAAAHGRPSSSIQLTEFNITSNGKGEKTRTEVTASSKTPKSLGGPSNKQEVVVLIEPDGAATPQMTICITEKTIIGMQNDIVELQQNISQLVELPTNSNLLESIKNGDKPVVEMFQMMSLAKRVDAAETGLQKLGSLVEDLTTEMQYAQLNVDGGDYFEDEYGTEAPQASTGQGGRPKGKAPASKPAQKPTAPPQKSAAKGKPQPGEENLGKGGSQEQAQDLKTKTSLTKGHPAEQSQSPGKGAQAPSIAETGDDGHASSKQSVTASMATEVTSRSKRSPPELVIKIGNSEKRLQAVEDTLKAYGIPPPIVPMIKYPSRIELPPIDINKLFLIGAQSPNSPGENGLSPQQSPPSPTQIALTPGVSPPTLTSTAQKVEIIGVKKKDEDLSRLPTSDAVAALQKDINKIKREVRKLKAASGAGKDTDDSVPSRTDKKKGKKAQHAVVHDDSQGVDLESKFKDSAETLISMDQNFNTQMLQLQNQFSVLEMEVNTIMEKLTAALPGGDSGIESIGDLFKKLQGMQIDIENIAETTANIVEDLATRKSNLENLNETVELLKTIKADKEDLEDALADKADKCAINRKVSHDQFDTACDELSKGIEEALEKLTTQELLWQQALDEIQFEISNKLDKMELGPLRDFINNKLRMLQERMKSLTALKKEQEAAGTKSKFLRNVNCISCDKDVVMRKKMDAALMPQPRALPPSRSMAPYLAYELDALRKQQKTLANSRNLNHFESAISGGKSPRMDDHVCNRYCGGSHTVTTPQQRVTRMGHFLAQWGPGAVPATDIVPTKEEPKQDTRQNSLTEQEASADQKKSPAKGAKGDGAPAAVPEASQKRASKGSIRSGSAGGSKPAQEPSKAGPGGDEKTSAAGSQEKVRTPTGSAKGSQGSVKKGSKGSISGSLKGSKQGSLEAAAAAEDEKSKEKPEDITEETPSEVAAAEAPASKEGSDQGDAQVEESPAGTAEVAEETAEENEEPKEEEEPAKEE